MRRRALCVAQATAGAARSGSRIPAGGRTSDGAAVPRNGPCRVASSLVRAAALLSLVPCRADSAARVPDDVHPVGGRCGVPRPADSRLPAPRSAVPARVGVLDRRHERHARRALGVAPRNPAGGSTAAAGDPAAARGGVSRISSLTDSPPSQPRPSPGPSCSLTDSPKDYSLL